MSLEHELEVYRTHLMDMLGVNEVNEGKYVVIKGDETLGVYDSLDDVRCRLRAIRRRRLPGQTDPRGSRTYRVLLSQLILIWVNSQARSAVRVP